MSIGQSNALGLFTNAQPWVGALTPTLYRASVPAEGWVTLAEHTADGLGHPQGHFGSVWPRVATLQMAARRRAMKLLTASVGGTGLVGTDGYGTINVGDGTTWAVGGASYTRAINAVLASGLGSIRAAWWFQGETDAVQPYRATLENEYVNAMVATRAAMEQALGFSVPIIVAQIGNIYPGAAPPVDEQPALNAIRRAQVRLWSLPGFYPGPVTADLDHSTDEYHFISDAHAVILAYRWWYFTNIACFGGTGGRGPRYAGATFLTGTSLRVTFSVANGGLAVGASPLVGWRITDADGAVTYPTGAAVSGSNITLTLPSAPALPCRLSWGLSADAGGATTVDANALPVEPFTAIVS